jgi:hypothetical protein
MEAFGGGVRTTFGGDALLGSNAKTRRERSWLLRH